MSNKGEKTKNKNTKKDTGTSKSIKWNVEGRIIEAETIKEAIEKALKK